MLGEGFLRILLYKEKRKFASVSKTQPCPHCPDPSESAASDSSIQTDSAEAGSNQEALDVTQAQGLRVMPEHPAGLLIPGWSHAPALDPDFTVCVDDCSLLDQYPDLQVADSGRISHNPLRATFTTHDLYNAVTDVHHHPEWAAKQEPEGDPATSIPDQGYLVMGDSENISLDLPGSGLEPMSNSVLNGLLDKQFEEVYMQHLTENLARCNSHLGNSLLHGLVPPPQPSSGAQGPDSLEACLEEARGDTDKKISYLNTHNATYSSNFSSPVLRISVPDNIHQ
ncbi:uncharacterized protein LOC115050197 [Echeneis naucrates]|uniref:uncharacterized protein LOC115050197 n=1 Tax=Echeneis naucrates TaxID=173247 RepID=UPI0011140DB7|nr:uncharacterized protein LOC115050197 [Echeneis naucrates]